MDPQDTSTADPHPAPSGVPGNRRFGLSYDAETQTFEVIEAEKARIVEARESYLAGESWESISANITVAIVWCPSRSDTTLTLTRFAALPEWVPEPLGHDVDVDPNRPAGTGRGVLRF